MIEIGFGAIFQPSFGKEPCGIVLVSMPTPILFRRRVELIKFLHPKQPGCSVSARDGGAQLASVISKRDSIAREKVPEMGLGV